MRDRAHGAEDYLGEEDRLFVGWRGCTPSCLWDLDPEQVAVERDADAARVDEILRALEGTSLRLNAFASREPASRDAKVTRVLRCRAAEVSVPSHCAGGPPVRCIAIDIAAEGFRRRMVRSLVAAAVRESLRPDAEYDPLVMLKLAAANEKQIVPVAVPAEGLCFAGVGY